MARRGEIHLQTCHRWLLGLEGRGQSKKKCFEDIIQLGLVQSISIDVLRLALWFGHFENWWPFLVQIILRTWTQRIAICAALLQLSLAAYQRVTSVNQRRKKWPTWPVRKDIHRMFQAINSWRWLIFNDIIHDSKMVDVIKKVDDHFHRSDLSSHLRWSKMLDLGFWGKCSGFRELDKVVESVRLAELELADGRLNGILNF